MGHKPVRHTSIAVVCVAHSPFRNATLGQGDADDRAFPDSIDLPPDDAKAKSDIASRFTSVPARQIAMGRLHTGARLVFGSDVVDSPLTRRAYR